MWQVARGRTGETWFTLIILRINLIDKVGLITKKCGVGPIELIKELHKMEPNYYITHRRTAQKLQNVD